ncbi:MAG: hypothetical protein R3328_00110 [Planococcaceae bacterium]|nr:hypothetical protein [Planococcaceae bacterium]
MSIVLIHTIGFSLCAGVVVANVFGLYKKSQKEVDLVSPGEVSLNAEVLGLSIEMARWGLDFVESKTDNLFDNQTVKELSHLVLDPFKVEPDGNYFKSAHIEHVLESSWHGYEEKEEIPVFHRGEFQMFI